jgi:shikimate dehydrogenase
MTPHDDASPWPEGVPLSAETAVYDLVYNPPQTRLMEQARAAGCRASNGLGMLAAQAALAFTRWTGRTVDFYQFI